MPGPRRFSSAGPVAALTLAAALVSSPALGQAKPNQIGSFTDWNAFTFTEGKVKTCYVMSRPKSSEPQNVKRGSPYVIVSHRPSDKVQNEVSVNSGYPFRKASKVEVTVGSERFELVTFDRNGYEETAWAPEAKVDQALVEAMARGATMTVKGVSERGTQTVDTYSLLGISAALKAIGEACK